MTEFGCLPAYGTLLGAVRHQGHILKDNRTNPDFTRNFMKIRKDHTTLLQDEEQ